MENLEKLIRQQNRMIKRIQNNILFFFWLIITALIGSIALIVINETSKIIP